MTLKDLLLEQFKVKTAANVNPVTAAVAAIGDRVLSNNPNRVGWIIINLSINNIWLAFEPTMAAATGIWLAANGGTVSMVWNEDFELVGWELFASAAAYPSAIYAVEMVTAE